MKEIWIQPFSPAEILERLGTNFEEEHRILLKDRRQISKNFKILDFTTESGSGVYIYDIRRKMLMSAKIFLYILKHT